MSNWLACDGGRQPLACVDDAKPYVAVIWPLEWGTTGEQAEQNHTKSEHVVSERIPILSLVQLGRHVPCLAWFARVVLDWGKAEGSTRMAHRALW